MVGVNMQVGQWGPKIEGTKGNLVYKSKKNLKTKKESYHQIENKVGNSNLF